MRTRLMPALIAVALFAGTANASGPATFEEAKTLAAKEKKPVLIDFYAVW
jgi:hypothetical protein